MEESSAVQCPTVAYQLAGAKKIQQDLASPETLSKFLDNEEDIKLAQSCFAGLGAMLLLVLQVYACCKGQRLTFLS